MSAEEQIRVEIKIVDGEWQWLGRMNEHQLELLCEIADALNTAHEAES